MIQVYLNVHTYLRASKRSQAVGTHILEFRITIAYRLSIVNLLTANWIVLRIVRVSNGSPSWLLGFKKYELKMMRVLGGTLTS